MLRYKDASGRTRAKALPGEPIGAAEGHSVSCKLEMCRQRWSTLRQLGRTGIDIEAYAYDRMSIDVLERVWRQWHAAIALGADRLAVVRDQQVLRLIEWAVATTSGDPIPNTPNTVLVLPTSTTSSMARFTSRVRQRRIPPASMQSPSNPNLYAFRRSGA